MPLQEEIVMKMTNISQHEIIQCTQILVLKNFFVKSEIDLVYDRKRNFQFRPRPNIRLHWPKLSAEYSAEISTYRSKFLINGIQQSLMYTFKVFINYLGLSCIAKSMYSHRVFIKSLAKKVEFSSIFHVLLLGRMFGRLAETFGRIFRPILPKFSAEYSVSVVH